MSKIKYIRAAESTTATGVSFKQIFRGVLLSIIVALLLILLSAVIFTYSDLEIRHSTWVVKIIFYLGALTSGFFSSLGTKNNGWLTGILGGLIFALGILCFGALVTNNFNIGFSLLIKIFLSIILGGIGGITGINLKFKKRK